jgi:hypothetical protein
MGLSQKPGIATHDIMKVLKRSSTVVKGRNFHNRRSATCGYEKYCLSGKARHTDCVIPLLVLTRFRAFETALTASRRLSIAVGFKLLAMTEMPLLSAIAGFQMTLKASNLHNPEQAQRSSGTTTSTLSAVCLISGQVKSRPAHRSFQSRRIR